jgi:hypothetical protein
VIDLDYPLLFVDRVEDAVPVGPQAPQVRRPVSERLRWPWLVGEPAHALPERSDTSGIVAEEAAVRSRARISQLIRCGCSGKQQTESICIRIEPAPCHDPASSAVP